MKKICILYDYTISRGIFNIFLLYFIRQYGLVVDEKHISTNLNLLLKYDIFVPTDVNSQYFIHKHKLTKNPMENYYIFKFLDDKYLNQKIRFNEDLFKIYRIPTIYNVNFKNITNFVKKHKSEKYIFKHRNSDSSKYQVIMNYKDTIINFKNFNKNFIMQKFIDNHYIYSFHAHVINGKIINYLYNYIDKLNGITFSDYLWQIKTVNLDKNDKYFYNIKSFVVAIVKKYNYSGLIEFEFLINNNKIYFLEINPRMCGHISQLHWNKSPYFNEIVVPYLRNEGVQIPYERIDVKNLYGTNVLSSYIFFILLFYKYIFLLLIIVCTVIYFIYI